MVSKDSSQPGDKTQAKKEDMPSTRFDDDPSSDDTLLPSPGDPHEMQLEIETLKKALQEEQEKAESHWERLLRREAEFQNLQKRAELDVENARKAATERFAGELLQVLDSLEQGLSYIQNGKATLEDLTQGMILTQSALLSVFEKQGIQVIDPAGQMFDPKFHEAISVQETAEVPPNTILAVVQKGYMLQNRLIRAARVVVSRAVS